MESRETRRKNAMLQTVPTYSYAKLFFDHLHSEYLALKPSIKDAAVISLLDEIYQKRLKDDKEKDQLTWSDIYTFDLTLVDARPLESLIRKAYDARAKYRSIAGQKEYDEYLASKPLDLASIQVDPNAQPPKPSVLIERELRADITYLLSQFYLYYALLPVREGLRDKLTNRAVLVTAGVVVAIALAIVVNVGGSSVFSSLGKYDQYSVVFVTVATVTLAGIVGGCVSMLQRIQAAPSEGDALFNLAALTSGWRAIILSPLYGGIFASLLFVLFAAGILEGTVFPTINTPKLTWTGRSLPSPSPTASPSPSTSPTTAASPTLSTVLKESSKPQGTTPSTAVGGTPAVQSEPQQSPSLIPAPSPPPARASAGVLQIKDFLKETGPADGVSYALLIVWSFLAGFAERLVPDTLNRLVAKNQAIQGGNN